VNDGELTAACTLRCAGVLRGQTGSGKTLAYLLPLIDQLRRDEKERGVETRARRPRALVVLPTRELVHQVRSLSGLPSMALLSLTPRSSLSRALSSRPTSPSPSLSL
jgi:Rad3-related DNA helicase